MEAYFLPAERVGELTAHLANFGKIYRYEMTESGPRLRMPSEQEYEQYVFPAVRATESAKFLLMKAKRKIAEYFDSQKQMELPRDEAKVIIGLKNCDLAAIKIWDNVFRDDDNYKDPFYTIARENSILVGTDCTAVLDTCFCNLMENSPYPAKGLFDLSLSPVDEGFVLFVGSEKGANSISDFPLEPASAQNISQINMRREKLERQLDEKNSAFKTRESYRNIVEQNPHSQSWEKHGSTCVSCAACTYICPTCFCFQIYDKSAGNGKYERFMAFDSCQYPRFSFMAGGLNPRGRHVEQFKHRYNHKFFHYHWRYGVYACTGCGRCIENCMGKIDMRMTLKDIENMGG